MNTPARREQLGGGMSKSEIARLLAFIASYDQRTVGVTDVEAWHLVATAAQWTAPYANRAVVEHFTDQTERLVPAHITRRIRARRAAAGHSFRSPSYPPGMNDTHDQVAWDQRHLAEHIAACMDHWARGEDSKA